MPRKPSICLTFTRRLGATTSSFISASRSVPPARIAPCSLSNVATCSFFEADTYSNGCMATSLLERFEYAVRRERQERHSHADGIRHGIRDCRAWRNYRRLRQSNDTALVVAFAGHHVDFQFANVVQPRESIELEIWIQHASGHGVENLLFVERVANAHNEPAVY